MSRYNKIIFVDTDDTARAPMACAIMQQQELNFPCEILSRGLVCLFPQPLNPKAREVMIKKGVEPKEHSSCQLSQEDITDSTLLFVMEENQKGKIWEEYEHALHVSTVAGFLKIQRDVPVLVGEPVTEYEKCYEALETLIEHIVIILNEEDTI